MPDLPPGVAASAEAVLDLTNGRQPTLGAGRLVCVDGPAGSGKTTLAAAIAAGAAGSEVVHIDDLLEGWRGLPRVAEQLDDVLVPLSEGRAGSYRRYDWLAGAFAETIAVTPTPLLVIEGVGSGARSHSSWCTVLVWVEVDARLRLARGMARDGEAMRSQWEQWMLDEQRLFLDEETSRRADMVV